MALSLPGVNGWGELSSKLGTPPLEWVPLFRLAGLEEAGSGDLCVLPGRASPLQVRACRAEVVVGSVSQRAFFATEPSRRFLEVPNPEEVFLEILEGPCKPAQDPEDWLDQHEVQERFGRFARTAMVHRAAEIGREVVIGAGAVIHPRVRLSDRVKIGEGTVVGADGFGLVRSQGRMVPLPHWAGVDIGEGTRIGPQCQISAGLLSPTRLGRECHLDAQIQVGHNCWIEDGCILAGQVGIAGSVRLGKGCVVGGQAGFADHVELGEGCLVAARAGVTRTWPPETILRGFPARPSRSAGLS